MIQDKHIQTLMDLGLTLLQAKTYLALANLENADVKTIAKTANVARQDIYRIMLTLQKLGLAEKMIAKPTMYKATPLNKGLSTLLQNKTENHIELQKKTNTLINNFKKDNRGIKLQENESQFIITSEKSLFHKKIKNGIDAAQTSVDTIYSREGFKALLFHHRQCIKRAMNRGVKIRVITEKPENQTSVLRTVQDLTANPLFKLKYASSFSQIGMVIFDNKEVHLRIADGAVPSFWSNHPNLVKLSASYFEGLWNKINDDVNSNQKLKRCPLIKPEQT
jgi:sugar-specific transcriptional regulator TrmB